MKKRHITRRFLLTSVLGILVSIVGIVIIATQTGIVEKEPIRRSFDFESGKPMIGFSIDALIIERWQRDLDILKNRAEDLGFQVEILNAFESVETQEKQIETLVEEGAVAIFIVAHDKDAYVEAIAKAKKAGVIVIAYDRLIRNANVDAYVSFDNINVGELMGDAIIGAVPDGRYVIINGSPNDYNSKMFHQGYMSLITPIVEKGQIEILEEVWADDWREEIAYDTISRLLAQEEQIDAIVCANDLLAEAAISVLSEYGLVGKVLVVGQDADISACQRIVEDKQLMTVYKPIKNLAEGSIDLVYEILLGKEVEFDTYINDGTYEIPYKKFGVVSVNKDNIRDTVINDFFHSEEDVYRFE